MTMSNITINKISNKKELTEFVNFHYDLYKGNKYDVPNLFSDEIKTLDKQTNAAFDFCEAE